MNKSIFFMLLTILMGGTLYLSAQEENNIINPDALTAQVQKAMEMPIQSDYSPLSPKFMALKLAAEKKRAQKLYGVKIIRIDPREKLSTEKRKDAMILEAAQKLLKDTSENARREKERQQMRIENLIN